MRKFSLGAAVAAGLVAVVSVVPARVARAQQDTAGSPTTKPAATQPAQSSDAAASADQQKEPKMAKRYNAPPPMTIDANKTYTATIDTTEGTMTAELYPKIAPNTVNSFVFLAREGFYDGVIFHRVIPGFMIQGGDPDGTGMGGPGYQLKAEFNQIKHTPGILSMARSQHRDSAGSQFFIMHKTYPSLDNQYTAFGKVTQGMEVVEKIVNSPRNAEDRPHNPPKIKSIKIEEK